MAGVRKQASKELSSIRRQSRGEMKHLSAEDDDSRPFSPDKQLKTTAARAKASTAVVRQPPGGLGLTGILPKHYLKSSPSSSKPIKSRPPAVTSLKRTLSTSSDVHAKCTAAKAATQLDNKQAAAAVATAAGADLPRAGTKLQRSCSLPSCESSGSDIEAVGQHHLLPSAKHGSKASGTKGLLKPSTATGGNTQRRHSIRGDSGERSKSNSRSNSNSRASSRGTTPPVSPAPAASAPPSKSKKQPAAAIHHSARCSKGPVGSDHATAVLGGRFVPPDVVGIPSAQPTSAAALQAALDAAAAIAAGTASVTDLLKLQLLQQQRWQQQQHKPQPGSRCHEQGDNKQYQQQRQQPSTSKQHQAEQQLQWFDQLQQHPGQQHHPEQQQHPEQQHPEQQHPEQQQQQQQQRQSQQGKQFAAALAKCSSEEAVLASLSSAEFEEVTKDVAARIIQAHWRLWCDTKRQQKKLRRFAQPQQQQQQAEAEHEQAQEQQQEAFRQWQQQLESAGQLQQSAASQFGADISTHDSTADDAVCDIRTVTDVECHSDTQWQMSLQQQEPEQGQQQFHAAAGYTLRDGVVEAESQDWQQDEQQQQQGQRQEWGSMPPGQVQGCVQQLLVQLQLDTGGLAALNGDSQLQALLAAALQQPQQQPAEEHQNKEQQQWKQQQQRQQQVQWEQQQVVECCEADQGSCGSCSGSCSADGQDAEPEYQCPIDGDSTAAPDGLQQFTQQPSRLSDGSSHDAVSAAVSDQPSASRPAAAAAAQAEADLAAAEAASRVAAAEGACELVDQPLELRTRLAANNPGPSKSPSKPAALARLRRSMDGRQAVQLQQSVNSTSVAATAGQAYSPLLSSAMQLTGCGKDEPMAAATATSAEPAAATAGIDFRSSDGTAAAHSLCTAAGGGSSEPAAAGGSVAAATGGAATATSGARATSRCGSMGAEKLGTILAYLDAVDAAAEEETAAALGAAIPQALLSREASQTVLRGAGMASGGSTSRSRHPSRPGSRAAAAVAAAATAAHAPLGRPVSAAAGTGCTTLSAEASDRTVMQSEQQHIQGGRSSSGSVAATAVYKPQQQQQQQTCIGQFAADGLNAGVSGGLLGEPSAAVSVGGYSMVSQGNRSAVLAESVFDGVRTKMSQLRAQLAEKEGTLAALQQELLDLRERHSERLAKLAEAHEQELAAAANDAAAAVSRHLAFIDRLLEDKQQLNKQLAEQQAAARAFEDRHAAAVAALKSGWAAELKRQQAAWEAGAAAKQEAWRTARTAEIKEQTVKGLEVEVQRLISRHRADLASTVDKAAEQSKAALEAAKAQHEAALAALKERMHQEREDALERERAAAACRLREACERYEAQMQADRLRLLADTDAKLESAAAAAREEKRRSQAALDEAAAAARQRGAQLREEWNREKEALERMHARATEAAKAATQDERSAWRAAVTEKIKRQAAEREEQLRALLVAERDVELKEVIRRLEEEQAAALAAAAKQIATDNAATIASLEAQLKEAKRGAGRLGDKALAAGQAAEEAEHRRGQLAAQLEQLRRELQLHEQQLSAAESALAAKEAEGRAAAAAAGAAAATALKELAADKGHLEGRLAALQQQMEQLKQQHEAEMVHVEYRVKGVIAKKDEAILRLQQQLSAALEQMRGTEAVLAAQQAELYD